MPEWLEILIAIPFFYYGWKFLDRLFPCVGGHSWRTDLVEPNLYVQTCGGCGKEERHQI